MSEAHESLLREIFTRPDGYPVPDIYGTLRIDFPPESLCGVYRPDAVVYRENPDRIQYIVELEMSGFTSKDIIGACILANHLTTRTQTCPDAEIIFVYPDTLDQTQRGHLEERLNIAAGYMNLNVREAMSASSFRDWFSAWFNHEFSATDGDLFNPGPIF